MKYVVEWYTTNSNEVSPEFESYTDAQDYAVYKSRLAGVSEVKIFDEDGELLGHFVDGEYVQTREDEDIFDYEDDYEYDEVGYNPYTGGYDEDL